MSEPAKSGGRHENEQALPSCHSLASSGNIPTVEDLHGLHSHSGNNDGGDNESPLSPSFNMTH